MTMKSRFKAHASHFINTIIIIPYILVVPAAEKLIAFIQIAKNIGSVKKLPATSGDGYIVILLRRKLFAE